MKARFKRPMAAGDIAPMPRALYRHRLRGYVARIVVFSRRRNFVKLLHSSWNSPPVWSGTVEQFWDSFIHADARQDGRNQN